MTNVMVMLAQGVEEMEATIIIDVLRRAQWRVVAVGLDKQVVTAARGMKMIPDAMLDAIDPDEFDMIVLPGGAGGKDSLSADERVLDLLKDFAAKGKWTAAVCAGPLVMQKAGILEGHRVTCYPGSAEGITDAEWVDQPVVIDGTMVTSQGPGTCFAFALALIGCLDGDEKAQRIAEGMIYNWEPVLTTTPDGR
ncbi:MAG: DJ-1/PfpI family protein [Spartobacteria bacterium]|nr:DJ-1/PfpI family protein [Spartobacteria bacterium]